MEVPKGQLQDHQEENATIKDSTKMQLNQKDVSLSPKIQGESKGESKGERKGEIKRMEIRMEESEPVLQQEQGEGK